MGRIQKKKDPSKKKARRTVNVDSGGVVASTGSEAVAAKPTPAVKRSPGTDKPKTSPQDQNFIQKSVQFVREVKIELKKVTWPTRKQTMGSTAVVIVLVLIISMFLGLVDVSLSSLIQMVLP